MSVSGRSATSHASLPAAVPIDLRIAERDQAQCQIASVEAFRVPADRDNRPVEIAGGQFAHLAAQAILRPIGEAAAQTGKFQPNRAGDRPAP